jgi:hypothetical protein
MRLGIEPLAATMRNLTGSLEQKKALLRLLPVEPASADLARHDHRLPGQHQDRSLRPLRGQAALERHRRRVLRQPALEHLAQERLRRVLVRARRARLQVPAQRGERLRIEPAAPRVQQLAPGFVARHGA